jgi:hypothetical protein
MRILMHFQNKQHGLIQQFLVEGMAKPNSHTH